MGRPAEDLYRDCPFLEGRAFTGQHLHADIFQELLAALAAEERGTGQNLLKLAPDLIGMRRRARARLMNTCYGFRHGTPRHPLISILMILLCPAAKRKAREASR